MPCTVQMRDGRSWGHPAKPKHRFSLVLNVYALYGILDTLRSLTAFLVCVVIVYQFSEKMQLSV